METLYRKVTFEIEAQDHDKTVLIGKSANFIFNPNTRNGEELSDFLSGCDDETAQLKSDKAELLEALKKIYRIGHKPYRNTRNEEIEINRIAESLIQKMKKCQENTPR